MNLTQVIAEVDMLTPNYLSNELKTVFINRVEGRILAEVMQVFDYHEILLEQGKDSYELDNIKNGYDIIQVMIGSNEIQKVDARTIKDSPYYYLIETSLSVTIRFVNCSLMGTATIITQKRDSKLDYTEDAEKELLIPFPYDQAYVQFLTAMTYHQLKDYDEYNNNLALYNNTIDSFINWYQVRKPKKDYKAKGWW